MSTLTISGDTLHFDDLAGPAGAPTIVWGHGFLLSAEFYHDVIARLPDHRHVIPDLRGHGRSAAATSDATLSRMADDIWDITQALGIDTFAYVGHSMGNAVGVRLVARHPDAVTAAVSIAGVPVSGKLDEAREGVAAMVDMAGDPQQLAAALAGLYVHETPDSPAVTSAGRTAGLVHRDHIEEVVTRQFFLDESQALLPELTQPWLFLVPSDDGTEPAEYQRAQAELHPDHRVVVLEGEGHMVPQERPQLVASHIADFLSEKAR